MSRMFSSKTMECEAERLKKFGLLPNKYKTAGFILAAASTILLLVLFATSTEAPVLRIIGKDVLLLSLLVISITKEKDEDEYTMSLRGRSYMLAFVAVVLYAIFQPYVNYGVANLLNPDHKPFESFDSFVIIWFMLAVQLGFYYLLRLTR